MSLIKTYRYLRNFLLATPLLFAACASEEFDKDIADTDNIPIEGERISLRISRPGDIGVFRAPVGGQTGDGYVVGNQWSPMLSDVDYDYELQDLCIFIYQSEEKSPTSSPAGTLFTHSYYLTSDDFEKIDDKDRVNDVHNPGHLIDAYYTKTHIIIPMGEMRPNLQMAVVGNVGDITNDVTTLGQLRDYIAARSFNHEGDTRFVYADCSGSGDKANVGGGNYSKFAMGLFEEPRWLTTVEVEGHEDDPHVVSVTLERLAARIDFNLKKFPSEKAQKADPHAPIPYDVTAGGSGSALAKCWITHVRLVNEMQKPSFLIRRTAGDPTVSPNGLSVKYLGEETADYKGITQNYVLAPFTNNMSASTTDVYFGNSAIEKVCLDEFTEHERVISRVAYAPKSHNDYVGAASALAFYNPSDRPSDSYFIIGYTNENTLRPEDMTRQYTTGLLYRTIYEPATIYRLAADGNSLSEPETVSLATDVLSDGTVPEGGYKSSHYGKTFWMIERLVPNPTEADRVYFVADASGDQEGEGADEKAGTTTDEGKEKIKRAAELYIAAHSETGWTQPIEYVGGVAYNYYWIRHSNSQGTGHPFSPMEYSIVRNNIYSIGITSFSGPGAPSTDPSMDNPDRIQPITYVHKWHPYTVDEIPM